MCLTKPKPIKTANKDIVCWKAVRVHDGYLMSPYRGFIYDVCKGYALPDPIEIYNRISFDGSSTPEVNEGFHSFKFLKDAISCFTYELCCEGFVILRCIIPKGSDYTTGVSFGYDNYVSNRIFIDKIVKPKK